MGCKTSAWLRERVLTAVDLTTRAATEFLVENPWVLPCGQQPALGDVGEDRTAVYLARVCIRAVSMSSLAFLTGSSMRVLFLFLKRDLLPAHATVLALFN